MLVACEPALEGRADVEVEGRADVEVEDRAEVEVEGRADLESEGRAEAGLPLEIGILDTAVASIGRDRDADGILLAYPEEPSRSDGKGTME